MIPNVVHLLNGKEFSAMTFVTFLAAWIAPGFLLPELDYSRSIRGRRFG